MVDDGEDGSAVDELEFDLSQLREARPDLAPENLVDFDREVAISESRPLSVDEIVNEYLPQPAETVEDGSSHEDEVPDEPIAPPSRNEVDEAIEILNRLTLFTTDLDLQTVTKIVRLAPPPPYSMLVASLSTHFWSWLPGMASSGLVRH